MSTKLAFHSDINFSKLKDLKNSLIKNQGVFFYSLTYFFLLLSKDHSFTPLITTNKNPPAKPIFLRKDIVCAWSEKSKWNKNAVKIQKIERQPAEILALYPTMINKGKIISKAIVGYIKNPGIPNPSIQLIDPSTLKILLYAEIKNNIEIKSLPRRSNKFIILKMYLIELYESKTEEFNLGFFWN